MKAQEVSPMMKHYLSVKEQYKDAIVFYRLGDFYEMFFEDAITMSKVLELTLTGKDCGLDERAPMCGIPVKAVEIYLQKAIEAGYKVAVCEQLTEPKPGQIVERDVIRVITPGTVMESGILKEKTNNYIASIFRKNNNFGISWLDLSTGEFYTSEIADDDNFQGVNDALIMIEPKEIIVNSQAKECETKLLSVMQGNIARFSLFVDEYYDYDFASNVLKKQLNCEDFKTFDLKNNNLSICSAGALIEYLMETQKRPLMHINNIQKIVISGYMQLDYQTRKNLELTKNFKDGDKKGSLLWLLDKTETSMGGRVLKKFIEQPLQNKQEINLRLNGVEEIYKNMIKRDAIISNLKKVYDIERICGKICYNSVNPRDCLSLKNSLKVIPQLKSVIKDSNSKMLKLIYENLNEHEDIYNLLENAIDENCSSLTKEGNFIKAGYSAELDELKNASTLGKNWIAELEAQEKELTGIKNLKIGYNKVFGYYIEVTNSQKDLIPFRYSRKQTLTNAERYVTSELKEIEEKILGSEEKAIKLELMIFEDIKNQILKQVQTIQNTAHFIGYLDALTSMATVAIKNNYVKPKICNEDEPLIIQDGRHPIVELINKNEFVPNDAKLDNDEFRSMIITGPNMAGKSTYMRQVAVITLLAHIGSFVPAKRAEIPITDRIFTRIGATDDLAYGQSTFMVEMVEVANILKNATNKSLIILDEIGRGTATFDGLSIAWSVMEYLSKHLKAKTLFSTHYHELTELEGQLEGVKNYRISVKEFNGSIIFLRKIVRGGANRSFGIEVASLAGLPNEIIARAKQLLSSLEKADITKIDYNNINSNVSLEPKSKHNSFEVINMIKELDVNKISPIEAFNILIDLKNKVNG